MALKLCKECGKEISTTAKLCPNCGKKNPTGQLGCLAKVFLGIVGLFVISAVITTFKEESPKTDQVSTPNFTEIQSSREDAYSLEDVLRLIEVDFNWHTSGFGGVMIADFKVTNRSKYKIKDIEITCYHYGKSGTKIDSNTRTIYDIVPAKGKKLFKDVNMGFFHSQTHKSGCKCTNLKIVE